MNTISKITAAFNFNAFSHILVYTPQKANDSLQFGVMSVIMTDSVTGTKQYINKPLWTGDWSGFNVYDSSIGAYRITLSNAYNGSFAGPNTSSEDDYSTPGVNSSGTLDVTIQFTGEDAVNFKATYVQNGWQSGIPQGLSLFVSGSDCINGLVRVCAQAEAKLGDNIDYANTNAMQLWEETMGTQFTATDVVNISTGNVYLKIWDLGLFSPGLMYDFVLIGASSISGTPAPLAGTTDYVYYSITTPECPLLAVANDDNVGNKTIGVSTTTDVSLNDIPCDPETTSYALQTGSEINVSGVTFVGSVFTYTPTTSGAFSFIYNILCDGVIINSATVSGIGVGVPANAVDDTVSTFVNTPITISLSSNDTLCN